MEAFIYPSGYQAHRKLTDLCLSKADLVEVAFQAASARNNASPLHPVNASGTFSYMEGVAALRQAMMAHDGWEPIRLDGIEAVSNAELNLSLVFQNVDLACGADDPKAISGKGSSAKKLVENHTHYLFPYMEKEYQQQKNIEFWFLCVSVKNGELRAELSLPRDIVAGQFSSFSQRIFILDGTEQGPPEDQIDYSEAGEKFDIVVNKK